MTNPLIVKLQEAQELARNRLDQLIAERRLTPGFKFAKRDEPAMVKALSDYNNTVLLLEQELDTDAPCAQVDSMLWSGFSDYFKSTQGYRPGAWTRAAVMRYYENCSHNLEFS